MWSLFYQYDVGITHFINNFSRQNWIADAVVTAVTSIGIPLMVLAVAGQWWSRSNRTQTRHVLLTSGFSFLLAIALNQIILLFVQRVRPYEVGVTSLMGQASLDSSFPSDHASAAFAIAFAFLLRSRTKQGSIFAICASVVALSRVYIGTHYISDVFGGILTAFAATIFVCVAYREDSSINMRLVKLF